MKEEEIKALFKEEIHKRSVGREAGLTKDQIYAYRSENRPEPTIGTMLEVLWKLDKLEFKL